MRRGPAMRWGDRKNASKQENYLKTHKICIFMGRVGSWRVYRCARPEYCGQPTVIYAWGDKKLFNWVLHTHIKALRCVALPWLALRCVTLLSLSFTQKHIWNSYTAKQQNTNTSRNFLAEPLGYSWRSISGRDADVADGRWRTTWPMRNPLTYVNTT